MNPDAKFCDGDYLEVRDGTLPESPLLARWPNPKIDGLQAVISTKIESHMKYNAGLSVYLYTSNNPCDRGCFGFTVREGEYSIFSN